MLISLPGVLALEVLEKPAQEKVGDKWVPKSDGSRIHELSFYQFGTDGLSRRAVIDSSAVDGVRKFLGKTVTISVDQRIYDNGNQRMTLVACQPSTSAGPAVA